MSPFDRGFIYGDAIYEVIPAFRGRLFAADGHRARLRRSAAAAYIDLPEGLSDALESTLAANEGWMRDTAVCRVGIWVSRGLQDLSWKASAVDRPTVVVFCWPVDDAALRRTSQQGLRAVIAARPRIPAAVLDPRLKMTSRLPMVLAELETATQGETPLLVDGDGAVTEGSSANVFVVVDGVLRTPGPEQALAGITRQLAIDYAREADLEVREERVGTYEFANASEVFMTSSSMGVVPVREVVPCRSSLPVPGPVTRRLMERFATETGFVSSDPAPPS